MKNWLRGFLTILSAKARSRSCTHAVARAASRFDATSDRASEDRGKQDSGQSVQPRPGGDSRTSSHKSTSSAFIRNKVSGSIQHNRQNGNRPHHEKTGSARRQSSTTKEQRANVHRKKPQGTPKPNTCTAGLSGAPGGESFRTRGMAVARHHEAGDAWFPRQWQVPAQTSRLVRRPSVSNCWGYLGFDLTSSMGSWVDAEGADGFSVHGTCVHFSCHSTQTPQYRHTTIPRQSRNNFHLHSHS